MKVENGQTDHPRIDVGRKNEPSRLGRAPGDGAAPDGRDSIEVGAQARTIQAMAREVGDLSSVDRERVDALRGQIAAGEFAPSANAIASALLVEMSGEGGA